jgi:triosephosphate isomerase
MTTSPPRPLIGTSWKMNLTSTDASRYLRTLAPLVEGLDDRDIFVLPPFTSIWVARSELHGTRLAWGAQDVHEDDAGAHTGDVSAPMLADLGCRFVEIGHSERRRAHGESDRRIGTKVRAALRWDMTPILCVGEPRRLATGIGRALVTRQLVRSLGDFIPRDLDRIVVAYEPVWAIGTGAEAAPVDHVNAMHQSIRRWLIDRGARVARVIYGGSVDQGNASVIMGTAGVDGLFVGRAALDPVVFAAIAATLPMGAQ